MTKIEDIEKNQENKASNSYLKDFKTLEEKTMKEINEIKANIMNFNEKYEKNSKILMDKTFSFQDPGISRKDIEDLERRISDKILLNFEKTYEVMKILTKSQQIYKSFKKLSVFKPLFSRKHKEFLPIKRTFPR